MRCTGSNDPGSLVQWLKDGNSNSKFFHAQATSRRANNRMVGLFDVHGIWQETPVALEEIIQSYYTNIFTSSLPSNEHLAAVLDCVNPCISPSMNHLLDRAFTPHEVKAALFNMFSTKVSRLDGMPALFYQKYWDRVGGLVTTACLRCLNDGRSVKALNSTLIVLIPKIPNPTRIVDFRPISLCNVIYTIVAKALVNCFRYVLGNVISENQSDFLPGQLITNNAIIGYECTQLIWRRFKGKVGHFALKLDMSKAYDRVEWSFLHGMLIRLGFSYSWV
ncbi:hypothetical protein ACOSP7_002085 [Xanthoceras sorbifolium]